MDRCIDQLFDETLKRLASYGIFLDKPLGDQPFRFSDYPEVQQVIDGIFEEFRQSVEVTITKGLEWEDNLSASKATDLASRYGVAVTQQRSQAVAGFAQRRLRTAQGRRARPIPASMEYHRHIPQGGRDRYGHRPP